MPMKKVEGMSRILLLAATVSVALHSCTCSDDDVIDLQELLRNVSSNCQDFRPIFRELKMKMGNVQADIESKMERCASDAKQTRLEDRENLTESLNRVEADLSTRLDEFQGNLRADLAENRAQNQRALNLSFQNSWLMEENAENIRKIVKILASEPNRTVPTQAKDCTDLHSSGNTVNGVYRIKPSKVQDDFEVYCDMETDGGGWTVIQRRGDYGFPKDLFWKTWQEYRTMFGDLKKEFWIGNENIYELSRQRAYVLRVDLWDLEGAHAFAKYSTFQVRSEKELYRLTVGNYTGDAEDSLQYSNGGPFSTRDRNYNPQGRDCAAAMQGAWWYTTAGCSSVNLNGLNLRGPDNSYHGIFWYHWKNIYSLPFVEMKLRPLGYLA